MPILRVLLATLAFFLCSSPVLAETSGFRSYQFDGAAFRESRGEGAILLKDGLLPAVAGEGVLREDPLPAGTGAVALFCYRQSAGGKLRRHAGFTPMAGVAVSVSGAGVNLAARANASGYLILALPPGSYEFRLFGFTKQVTVETGKNALVSIRGGKRMVD